MRLSEFSLLLAVGVVAANAATVGLAAGLLLRRRPVGAALRRRVQPFALPFAATAAVLATAGSLTLSERYHLPPCRLCWYQRYAMYPLAVLLTVAAATRQWRARALFAVVAAAGLSVSTYHVLLERFPTLDTGSCDLSNPCSVIWFERFGFVTIPYGAGSVFLLVLALLPYAKPVSTPGDNRSVELDDTAGS